MSIIAFSEVSKEYNTKTGVVHAVTDITLQIKEGRLLDWLDQMVLEKVQWSRCYAAS